MDVNGYDLNEREGRQYAEALANLQAAGGLFRRNRDGDVILDAQNRAEVVTLEPLRSGMVGGSRYAMDAAGTVWHYRPQHAPKDAPGSPGRVACVEMWTGRWRKLQDAAGKDAYAKCLIWAPVGPGVNEKPGIDHLTWYKTTKGYVHPHGAPHAPTKQQLAVMERSKAVQESAIFARMDELAAAEGMDAKALRENAAQPPGIVTDDAIVAAPVKRGPGRPRRSNRDVA